MAPPQQSSWLRGPLSGLGSLVVHGGLAALVLLTPPQDRAKQKATMELTERKLEQKKKPPPPPPDEPKKEEPKPEPIQPKKVVRKRPKKAPPPPPPESETPPEPDTPPNDEPPDTGPKTFGIQMEGGTQAGPGQGVAVPVGDSLAVSPTIRKRGKKKVSKKKPSGFKKTYKRGEMAPVAVVTTRPKVRKRVMPDYPERLRELGIEGRVVLELTIDESGKVIKIKVLRGLRPELDQAAKDAAQKMLFAPATVGGTPVKIKIPYTFTFVLD